MKSSRTGSRIRALAGVLLAVSVAIGACSQGASDPTTLSTVALTPSTTTPTSTTSDLMADETVREQIHAATGHEPEQCVDSSESSGVTIEDDVMTPDCVIVHGGETLLVSNASGSVQTFAIADPPGPNPQHDHHRIEIEPGDRAELSDLDSLPGPGAWRMYSRGGDPLNGILLVIR